MSRWLTIRYHISTAVFVLFGIPTDYLRLAEYDGHRTWLRDPDHPLAQASPGWEDIGLDPTRFRDRLRSKRL